MLTRRNRFHTVPSSDLTELGSSTSTFNAPSSITTKNNPRQTISTKKVLGRVPLRSTSPTLITNKSPKRWSTVTSSLVTQENENQLPPISFSNTKSNLLHSTRMHSSERITWNTPTTYAKKSVEKSSKKQIDVSNYYDFFTEVQEPSSAPKTRPVTVKKNELNNTIKTPSKERTITKLNVTDYTASGRALIFIENYIINNVLPYYANTHSEHNACASQTTKFREGSRSIIKQCVNANDDDVVIFTGSGSTSAINKLVDVLNLRDEKIRNKTVVLITTFEHHSNILPWKETGIEVIRIPNNKLGLIDEEFLRNQLKYYHDQSKKHIICTFNAASNVTGIRIDVDKISQLVHKYDGWIFWDYAAAAPYVNIDMNPSKTAYKEAVFISTHKFVGGPSTPGILIAKKKLFTNPIPSYVGGGTVNFVTRTHTEYVKDIETREEGGTPNIIGAIRAGLVFQLKESVGFRIIEIREDELVAKFFTRFRKHPRLYVLGSATAPRLGIFSFLVYVPSFKKYLHHNFVCVLLNDLFGIQVRSGCSCAGPYVLDLLNIDDQTADIYTKFIAANENARLDKIHKNELLKPGFTRFNLSYFISDEEVDYILNAVEVIANDGWKFLPMYTYNSETAAWYLRTASSNSQYHNIHRITYQNGIMEEIFEAQQIEPRNSNILRSMIKSSSNDPIGEAKTMANNIPNYVYENIDFKADPPLDIPDEYQDFIWFVLPKDIIRKMIIDFEQNREKNCKAAPFRPKIDEE
ncbi:unnamed protein product [Rotaria sp. Silwood2]|nr:unnamed protein product [Rotaria sp. Silwood2]CAF4234690.1 unnamed protein product [Rotaria sp. Silwood2]